LKANTRAALHQAVEVKAPATLANMGAGFDILGFAVADPCDVVQAEPCDEHGAHIAAIHGDEGKLPLDPAKNTATIAANHALQRINAAHGVRLTIHKGIASAGGLGSSAASAVAGAVAVNALFGQPLSHDDLLPSCVEGEAFVSGYHADNIAPCLYGGVTLVVGVEASGIRALPIPSGLYLAMVTPHIRVETALARACLPQTVALKTMIAQTGAVAKLIDALYRNDLAALAAAMEGDSVIEPARAHLMPLLHEQRAVAKQHGALGLVISGAGPTLCALCTDTHSAEQVAAAMAAQYQAAGYGATGRATQIIDGGASTRVLR
jgi:homoserine kinase